MLQGTILSMPNIATVLKAEITRLARKELREESDSLRRTLTLQRKEIASLKQRILTLEKAVRQFERTPKRARSSRVEPETGAASNEGAAEALRFRASGLASNRKRLGLSAADFALLVGTTGQSIYAWEAGKAKPRAQALKAIAALRHIGKREVGARLAELKG